MTDYAEIYEHTLLSEEPIYTVFGIPKDRSDDMTDGRGQPKRGATDVTYDEAADYAERNESPDNNERYVIRYRVEATR
jgi:hypothetical protein